MTNSCLGKIRSYYERFSEKDKIIANYILENPDSIIHRTINEVAEDLNVADATVFRFCKRIGFKGYQAIKIALALESNTQIKQIHEEISEQDNEKTIGITSFPRSPISLNVDVALYTSSDKAEYRSEANVSRIAQLSLIDALYENLKSLNKEKVH
ncbi:hypothetical protein NDK43_17210 [Neobacillus pocheonensis]|uniref:HTH rpiR-type domain-containing protein n=1 Tax=Neobacillus pocheonensis TaxID=363869 RepID=A0ABT0WCR3_9BACI|nr:hypothetical protein [Neobacillus pocheonensis]